MEVKEGTENGMRSKLRKVIEEEGMKEMRRKDRDERKEKKRKNSRRKERWK